jgi:phosphinothricin acetyltransferase
MLIRPSTDADLPALTAIYAHHVDHGTGTFETEPPGLPEMTRRRNDVLGKGLPWLVAEDAGTVIGYAYANHFRPRLAYRFCLEDSIYLAPGASGRGVGRLLLGELVARCEALGARQMLAVIGDARNAGSIGVHRALGFEDTGVLKSAGWKFGRWLDVVLMQRALGPGDGTSPVDAPDGTSPVDAPDGTSPVDAPDGKSPVDAQDPSSPAGRGA